MKILGIESSCDETAAAVIEDGRKICSSVIHTQVEEHKLYGGVVPEIASRRHIESICGVTAEALEQAGLTAREVDAVAVTAAPGLIGAVLVGGQFRQGLGTFGGKAPHPGSPYPRPCGGKLFGSSRAGTAFFGAHRQRRHSHIVLVRDYCDYTILGRTTDDAAGEAFDKAAAVSACPIPAVWRWMPISHEGDPHAYPLPTPHAEGEFNFSFSGLKTAVINLAHNAEQKGQPLVPADLAASFCCHVSEILWQKTALAAERCGCDKIVLAGGVSANSWLRQRAGRVVPKKAGSFTCRRFLSPGIMPL